MVFRSTEENQSNRMFSFFVIRDLSNTEGIVQVKPLTEAWFSHEKSDVASASFREPGRTQVVGALGLCAHRTHPGPVGGAGRRRSLSATGRVLSLVAGPSLGR